MRDSFEKELRSSINYHGKDSEANTPDYVLAQYLVQCLDHFTTTIKEREKHTSSKEVKG